MSKFLLLISFISIVFFNSCSESVYKVSANRNDFYVMRINGSQYAEKIKIFKVGETANLIIYAESGYSINYNYVIYVAKKFEDNYSKMINIYGNHTDVDKNGKIIILFQKINANISGNSIVMGYFLPNDLIYGDFNNAEILYMDINLLNKNPQLIAGTVLHEFQHLINFNVNYIQKGKDMSLWLNESLSESTSILFDSYMTKNRIEEFNNINYYCFYTWDLPFYPNMFVNYPSASVFMNWLYQKNNRNESVFRNIAHSSESEDYKKVLGAAGYGNDWEGLLINWIDGIKKGQVNGAKINNWNSTWTTTAYLYPGALVYGNSKIHVNPSTDLSGNPQAIRAQIYEDNFIITSRSADNTANENNIYLQTTQKPKYIDLVFDKDGKIKKY
ncbi:peptidase M30 hyicolysin [Brachyspira sp. CAG:700]|nr:peptidase M30 hyicolysin [Brachyspira sp. CAG:700]